MTPWGKFWGKKWQTFAKNIDKNCTKLRCFLYIFRIYSLKFFAVGGLGGHGPQKPPPLSTPLSEVECLAIDSTHVWGMWLCGVERGPSSIPLCDSTVPLSPQILDFRFPKGVFLVDFKAPNLGILLTFPYIFFSGKNVLPPKVHRGATPILGWAVTLLDN